MTGSDTHADTIRALREKAMQATIAVYKQTRGRVPVADAERLADRLASLGLDALAAIDALVAERDHAEAELDKQIVLKASVTALIAERDRERARADRAEAALKEIAEHRTYGSDLGMPDHGQKIARAALSAGSGERENRPPPPRPPVIKPPSVEVIGPPAPWQRARKRGRGAA